MDRADKELERLAKRGTPGHPWPDPKQKKIDNIFDYFDPEIPEL